MFAEEQREELPLVSWSSVAEAPPPAVSLKFWPSLSLLLELLMEQTSWRSPASHRDTSAGGGASAAEPRRRHRLVRLSKVQLGLMAQKSSSSFSSPWKENEREGIYTRIGQLWVRGDSQPAPTCPRGRALTLRLDLRGSSLSSMHLFKVLSLLKEDRKDEEDVETQEAQTTSGRSLELMQGTLVLGETTRTRTWGFGFDGAPLAGSAASAPPEP